MAIASLEIPMDPTHLSKIGKVVIQSEDEKSPLLTQSPSNVLNIYE
jgi:hypothetical protein